MLTESTFAESAPRDDSSGVLRRGRSASAARDEPTVLARVALSLGGRVVPSLDGASNCAGSPSRPNLAPIKLSGASPIAAATAPICRSDEVDIANYWLDPFRDEVGWAFWRKTVQRHHTRPDLSPSRPARPVSGQADLDAAPCPRRLPGVIVIGLVVLVVLPFIRLGVVPVAILREGFAHPADEVDRGLTACCSQFSTLSGASGYDLHASIDHGG